MIGWMTVAAAVVAASLIALAAKLVILRRIGSAPFGSDTWFYLGYTHQMRRNGHRVPSNVDFLFGGTTIGWAIPSLLPWLFSFAPRAWLDRHHALVPIGAKVATVLVLSLGTGAVALELLPPVPAGLAAFAAGVIYALSPVNWNANPSNLSDFTYSPRAAATLCSVAAGLTTVLAAVHNDWILALASVVAIAASVLTAKFSAQVCALILPLMTLFTGDSTYTYLTAIGFLLAVVVSRGQILASLATQLRHLIFYARDLVNHRSKHRSPLQTLDFVRVPLFLFQRRWRDLRTLCFTNIVFRGLLLYPVHMALAIILIGDWLAGGAFLAGVSNAGRSMLLLWLATILMFMLTSLRQLLFLGEADRYLDYLGFAPATLVLALWLMWTSVAASAATVVFLAVATWLAFRLSPPPRQDVDHAMEALCGYLAAMCPPRSRLLPVPITMSFELNYKTGLESFFPLPLDDSSRDVILRYPIPAMDLHMMRNRFGVTHFVLQMSFAERTHQVAAAVADLDCLFDNGTYRVYDLRPGPLAPRRQETSKEEAGQPGVDVAQSRGSEEANTTLPRATLADR
jgi:hypothetical protein